MSDKRIIKVNPDLFKIPDTTKKKREPKQPKEIKVKSNRNNNNTTVKKKLLNLLRRKQDEKIKESKSDFEKSVKTKNQEILDTFESEFQNSLDYLNNLTKNNSQTISHNTTIKQPVFVDENVSLTLPKELRSNDVTHNLPVMVPETTEPPITLLPKAEPPKYGCLKNGSLPTFRSWRNQTQRQYPSLPSRPLVLPSSSSLPKKPDVVITPKKPSKRQKMIRRNFTIGKYSNRPKIGVLVSNKTLRKHTTTKQKMLQQTPLDDIKKTLVKKGFIKIGCSAPPNVLRKMYECVSLMCGDIKNHNPDNLLYNYLNSNDNY